MKKQVTELVMNVTNESYDAICRREVEPVRNVSKKFYADICERVAESVMVTGGNDTVVERTMVMIDAYISKGIKPDEETESVGILIIFHILKRKSTEQSPAPASPANALSRAAIRMIPPIPP